MFASHAVSEIFSIK